MRRVVTRLCLVAGGCLLASGAATACGDKPLVTGRHVTSQRVHGAVHHGSILLFLDDRGHLETALREMRLEEDLELAGHSLRMVSNRDDLIAEIRSGNHDVLIADITGAAALGPEVLDAPGSPTLLPVVVNATGEEWAEAVARLSCLRRSPIVGKHYLAVIEDAIVQGRARGRAEKSR